jgi:hypothetical protein
VALISPSDIAELGSLGRHDPQGSAATPPPPPAGAGPRPST